jgi:uncharacterized lipoprotein YddW (UPF0748 family)
MNLPLVLLLAATHAAAAPLPAPEMRGLWVVRTALVSPEAVDRVVDQAAEAGFNALFVQVRGRGDAFYESRLAPRSPLLARQPREFDPLARLIERARGRRLEVHAWANVLLAAGFANGLATDHVVARHPEWVMVPRQAARAALAPGASVLRLVRQAARSDADVEGYYLSPAVTGVQEHLSDVVRELLRGYAVDGLHLDFIRYPGRDYDYSRAALEGFRRRSGGRAPLHQLPDAASSAWADYRRETLTELASRLAEAARATRPGARITAAVVPDLTAARELKGQLWTSWVSRGILDAVCPMTYTPDPRIYREQVEQARAAVGGARVWAGVGAYRLPLEGTIEFVGLARAAGAGGVVIFSHESLGPDDARRLREQAFPARAAGGSSEARPALGALGQR